MAADRRREISAADTAYVSVVSLWEIAVKLAIGKTSTDLQGLAAGIAPSGLTLLGLTSSHCLAVATLPLHHRDPFDRMLVAQAIVEGLAIVTSDRKLDAYGVTIIRCG